MLRSPPMTSRPPPCLTYFSSSSLRARQNRFQIPVIENHKLIRRQIAAGEIVRRARCRTARPPASTERCESTCPRVLRYVQNLRTPQHHGLIEAHFASRSARMAIERSSAPGVFSAGVQPHRILARLQVTLGLPQRVAFGRHLHFRRSPPLAPKPSASMGNCSPVKASDGRLNRFQAQRRFRPALQRERVDGNPQLLRLPCRARNAAFILLAV